MIHKYKLRGKIFIKKAVQNFRTAFFLFLTIVFQSYQFLIK